MSGVDPTALKQQTGLIEFDRHLGPTIQDNDKIFAFGIDCCSIYHACYTDENIISYGDFNGDKWSPKDKLATRCENHPKIMKWYGCIPNRCKEHDKERKIWLNTKKMKEKLKAKFNKHRHHHVRMVTLGLPGKKISRSTELWTEISLYRDIIKKEFKKLRERKIWNKSVDGGIYFFECTETVHEDGQTTINPHLHMVLLCPQKFGVKAMNEYVSSINGINLGRFWISTPRDKKGRIKKTTPESAIHYCVSYMKNPNQIDGKNRQSFGNMYN